MKLPQFGCRSKGHSVFEPLEHRRLMSTTIAFFDDPGFVNTSAGSDANDLLAQLQSYGKYTVNTFTGTTAAAFTSGLSGANLLVIPSLDQADLSASLSSSAIAVIDAFVSGGNGLIITGDPSSHTENFLNTSFGFSTSYHYPDAPYPIVNDGSTNAFTGGPSSLAGNTNTSGLLVSGLPTGSENIYDGSGTYGTTVALLPYAGADQICFMGWDWTNGGPQGTQDGGWNTVLQSAITQLTGGTVTSGGSVVVNSTSDTATGSGVVTLRDAIATANASTTPTTITFDPTVFATAQTITLSGTQLEFSNTAEATTITGPTAGITVSGAGLSRVFQIDSGVSVSLQSVSVKDGMVPGNDAAGNLGGAGGGIFVNAGTLAMSDGSISESSGSFGGGIGGYSTCSITLTGVTLSNNTSQYGGAIDFGLFTFTSSYNASGALVTLIDSTVSGNTSFSGGGISDFQGAIVIKNSTVTNNTVTSNSAYEAYNSGGGLLLYDGPVTIDDSTIADNTSDGSYGDGGIVEADSVVQIANSIVASNTATTASGDIAGQYSSGGYNLIGETDGSSGWTNTDLKGTAASPLSAGLGVLADNGGPTQTMLPQPGSLAIGHGSVSLIPSGVTTDQRGDPRTIDGAVDIGAVEVGGTVSVVGGQASVATLTLASQTLVVGQSSLCTVKVASSAAGGATPTGSITIYSNGVAAGTYTLANGQVQEPITADTAGTASLYAVYGGDSSFTSSTSATITQTYLSASTAGGKVTTAKVPSSAIIGQKYASTTTVVLTNQGPKLKGDFLEQLYLDAASVGLSSNPTQILSKLVDTTLATGRKLAASFVTHLLPTSVLAGVYHLVAKITDPLGNVDLITLVDTVTVAAPVVIVSATAGAVKPATVAAGKSGSVVVSVTNSGNINAVGSLSITLSPSSDGQTAVSGITLATLSPHVTIKPGKASKFTLHFKIPASLSAGMYYPLVNVELNGVSATAVGGSVFDLT